MNFTLASLFRHAEPVSPCGDFVPASIASNEPPVDSEKWTLKQVQGDEHYEVRL